MTEREVYPNTPLVLVALEVRHPTVDLTAAQRQVIKQRLNDHTPILRMGRQEQLTVVQSGGATPASELRTEEFPRLFTRDNTTAVSMRSDALIIETTRYSRWEELRALVAGALAARQDVGGIDGVERVGLRYVNEVRVPDASESGWDGWIDPTLLGPALIRDELGLAARQWQGTSAFAPGPDRQVVLRYGSRHGFAVNPGGDLRRTSPTPGPFFLIDIDSFWVPSDGVPEFDMKTLLATSDELHAPVRTLFERLISDRLREEVLRRAE